MLSPPADWIPTRAQWLCLFVFIDLILSLILQGHRRALPFGLRRCLSK